MGKKKEPPEGKFEHEKQLIAELFLKPLILHKPVNKPVMDFLKEDVFHVHTRHLETFAAKEKFYLSGLIKKGFDKTQGRIDIKKGARLVVRTDDTTPKFVEVSVMVGRQEVVVVIDDWIWRAQWKKVKSLEKDEYSVPRSYRPPPKRNDL